MRLGVMFLAMVSLVGCTGAELAVVGAASEGLRTGQEVTRSGKVRIAVMADGERAAEAGRTACEQLGLKVIGVERKTEHHWLIRAADYKNTLRIRVEQRTPRMSQVEVNVGILGSGSVAELVLKRVVAELEPQLDDESER